jgi:class 3 adenylate cyclase
VPSESAKPDPQSLERKLSTILSADVAEFSRLMSEDEEGTLRTFRGHKEIFESLVAMHRGRVFNTAGDAILAEFNSAVEAVRCATDIQTALGTRNDKLPPNRQVRFRIGVNLGDVMVQGQDLLGDGVNVAARLQTAAEPGGVCISGSVHDQIRNKLSLTFHSLGERTYKNIAQPVRTFSVMEAEGGAVLPTPRPSAGGSRTGTYAAIAVVLLLLLGGGYWAYMRNAAGKSEAAQTPVAPPPQPASPSTTLASSPSGTESPSANPSQPGATPAAGNPSSSAPAPAAKSTDASQKAALLPTPPAASAAKQPKPGTPAVAIPAGTRPTAAPANPVPPSKAGPFDGVYAGQVCFGETKREPGRCFHGQGTVSGNRITGKWQMGKDAGVTMFLEGDVSDTGDVKMKMHTEKADGSRVITVDFTGTIQDVRLDATGRFRAGRSATLNWHKAGRGGRKAAQ